MMENLQKAVRDYSMDYWRAQGYSDEQIWDAVFKSHPILLREHLKKTFSRRPYYMPTEAEIIESILRKDEIEAEAIIERLRQEWSCVTAEIIEIEND